MLLKLFHVLLVLSLCSCSFSRTIPPAVALTNIEFGNFTFLESTLLMEVRLENENPDDLQLSGAVHELSINGAYVGRGMSDDHFTIPSFGSTLRTVVIHVDNIKLLSGLRSSLSSESFEYRLRSKLYHGGLTPYETIRKGRYSARDHETIR